MSICFQSLLCEIITGLRSASMDAASSSTHPIILATKPVNELLSEVVPVTSIVRIFSSVCISCFSFTNFLVMFISLSLIMQDSLVNDDNGLGDESSNLQVNKYSDSHNVCIKKLIIVFN